MADGPCVVCGATHYSLSMGGPTICPSCDCGIDPELSKCRVRLYETTRLYNQLEAERDALKVQVKEITDYYENKEPIEAMRKWHAAERTVQALRALLKKLEFNFMDRCSICLGWSKRDGERRHVHTKDCEVKKALDAERTE